MGDRVNDYIDLATRTLAYLKALDPWFPNPDGADGEARILAWADAFAAQELKWGEIKASVDTFTINAPSGAHAGIQDVLRGVRDDRAHRKSVKVLENERKQMALPQKTSEKNDSCHNVYNAINFNCPECGAIAGIHCTNNGKALHAPHVKRLLRARKSK